MRTTHEILCVFAGKTSLYSLMNGFPAVGFRLCDFGSTGSPFLPILLFIYFFKCELSCILIRVDFEKIPFCGGEEIRSCWATARLLPLLSFRGLELLFWAGN